MPTANCIVSAALLTILQPSDFISNESVYYIRLTLGFILQFSVLLFGMSTNIINTVVFIKIGISDPVSVSFFALSTAHFGCLFLYFVGRVFFVLKHIFKVESYIDFGAIFYLVAHYSSLFEDVADGIIVFIAVQKCCCVAIPFHFKNTFTYARTVSTIVVMYLAALAYYLPSFTGQWLGSVFYSSTNRTVLVYTYYPRILFLLRIAKVLNGLVLPVLSHSLVILCSVVLSTKLKQAVKFRNSKSTNKIVNNAGSRFEFSNKTINPVQKCHNPEPLYQDDGNREFSKRGQNKLKGKELKVVQAVYFTAILFVASNIGGIPVKFVGFFIPDFQDMCGSKYYNTYVLVTTLQTVLDELGTGLHIFIYMKFNHKYRGELKSLLFSNTPH